MEVAHPGADLAAANQPTFVDLLAGGLLALAVVLHIVAMFPDYFGGPGATSLWSQPDQAAAFVVLAGGWALALAIGLTSPARAGLAAGLAVGLAITEFGFRLSDLGYVFRYGTSQAAAGLWLMTAAWLIGAIGAGVAVLAARRRHRLEVPDRSRSGVTAGPDPLPATDLAWRPPEQIESGPTSWPSVLAYSRELPRPPQGEEPSGSMAVSTSPWAPGPAADEQAAPEPGALERDPAFPNAPHPVITPTAAPTVAPPPNRPVDATGVDGAWRWPPEPVGPPAPAEPVPWLAPSAPLATSYRRAAVVVVVLLAVATAGAFLPAWDRYSGVETATGRVVSFTAGNAFSAPWQAVVGTVVVALALLAVPIVALRMRSRAVAAVVVAGSLIVLGSQFVDAIVQLDQPIPSSIISPDEANQLGLQLHLSLTGWFTFDLLAAFGLFAAMMILGHVRLVHAQAEGQASSAGTWPSAPEARRAASFPGS